MLKEFKEFAIRGNVLDMAIGVIIGGAFGKIVSSLVSDVLMPPMGLLMGKVDFSSLFIDLSRTSPPSLAAAKAAGCHTANGLGMLLHQGAKAFEMLVELEHVQLFLLGVPVGTDPLEGRRAVEEGVRHHADLRVRKGSDRAVEVGDCGLWVVRQLSLLRHSGRGAGQPRCCGAYGRSAIWRARFSAIVNSC